MFKLISDNTIEISGNRINLPASIMRFNSINPEECRPYIVEFDHLVMMVLMPKTDEEKNNVTNGILDLDRNIWAFNQEGELVWKIHAAPKIGSNNVYTGIGVEDGILKAYNWNGCYYFINPQDGSVTMEKGGRPW